MKILDEIRAYNGKLDYREVVELVSRLNNIHRLIREQVEYR